jgi:splicing factor 1
MSYRSGGITGTNNVPLGNRRRFGPDNDSSNAPPPPPPPSAPASAAKDSGSKRGRDMERRKFPEDCVKRLLTHPVADAPTKRKRKNRWGDQNENKAAGLMGLPTAILAAMTSEQLEAYTLHLRIEEISQKLRINDVVPGDGERYVFPLVVEIGRQGWNAN